MQSKPREIRFSLCGVAAVVALLGLTLAAGCGGLPPEEEAIGQTEHPIVSTIGQLAFRAKLQNYGNGKCLASIGGYTTPRSYTYETCANVDSQRFDFIYAGLQWQIDHYVRMYHVEDYVKGGTERCMNVWGASQTEDYPVVEHTCPTYGQYTNTMVHFGLSSSDPAFYEFVRPKMVHSGKYLKANGTTDLHQSQYVNNYTAWLLRSIWEQ